MAQVNGAAYQGYQYDGNQWVQRTGDLPCELPKNVRAVTFNVLMDTEDKYYSTVRFQRLFDILRDANADIIVLVECTAEFVVLVTTIDWVRAGYWMTDIDGTTCPNYGQLILSRFPMTHCNWDSLPQHGPYKKQYHKELVTATIGLGPEVAVRVAGIHLKSGLGCADVRRDQLLKISRHMRRQAKENERAETPAPVTDCMMLGDFNLTDNEEDSNLDPDYSDAWTVVNRRDPGYTFTTRRNGLAQRECHPHTIEGRIDRILHRSGRLRPAAAQLIGTAPIEIEGAAEQMWASDHFGVAVDFVFKRR